MPDLSTFTSSNAHYYYNIKDVRKYEEFCLKCLNYKLGCYTAYSILRYFLNLGIVFEDEFEIFIDSESNSERSDISSCRDTIGLIYSYSYDLIKTIIKDNKSLLFNQMQLALSIIVLTRDNFKFEKEKTKLLLIIYGYDYNYFSECMNYCRNLTNTNQENNSSINNKPFILNYKQNGSVISSHNNFSSDKKQSNTSKELIDLSKNIEEKLKLQKNRCPRRNSITEINKIIIDSKTISLASTTNNSRPGSNSGNSKKSTDKHPIFPSYKGYSSNEVTKKQTSNLNYGLSSFNTHKQVIPTYSNCKKKLSNLN